MSADLPQLPPRPADGHKGTFGTVCVLGGQCAGARVMLGGPALAALAALRSGAGLAVLALPRPLIAAGLGIAPAATGLALPVDKEGELRPSDVAELLDLHLPQCHCLVVGPGLGTSAAVQKIMMRLVGQGPVPMVIDADALNVLAVVHDMAGDFKCQAILTPHPGEFRRLADALELDADPVDPDADPVDPDARGAAAAALARRMGCVVVLKGAGTVVSDGLSTWTNETGNVVLATGGSGDVLAGVIGGLVAQYVCRETGSGADEGPSLFDCARLGVHLHGLAADRWASRCGSTGMLATDLLDEIPGAIGEVRG